MPKAQAIQINWQFTGSAGIMQVEHTADCFGGAWFYTTENVLPNDNVSMSVGRLDHIFILPTQPHMGPGDSRSRAPPSCKQKTSDGHQNIVIR